MASKKAKPTAAQYRKWNEGCGGRVAELRRKQRALIERLALVSQDLTDEEEFAQRKRK